MKYGICTSFEQKGMEFSIPQLEFIKKSGFDYLELSLNAVAALAPDAFRSLKDYLEGCGLPVLCLNCFMPGILPMTGANFGETSFQTYVLGAVNRAGALGAKKLVLGSGASRNIPSGFPKDKAQEQFSHCLDFILSVVQKYGIQLELEHLNRLESNIVTSFRESSAMVLERNEPHFKSILDYFHFALGNEDETLITERSEAIGHIHFARPLGRVYPNLLDLPELSGILERIKNTDYNSTFSMECGFPDMAQEPTEYGVVLAEIKKMIGR